MNYRFRAKRPTVFLLGITFVLAIIFQNRSKISSQIHPSVARLRYSSTDFGTVWNRKIWQTSPTGVLDLTGSDRKNSDKWNDLNPQYRYELLTDEGCDAYVRRAFEYEPEIIGMFTGLQDSILRADLIRYLVLLGDGGVYSDMDSEPLKPIDEWIPTEYKNFTNAVVGIEYDTFGLGHEPALLDVQFVNWTLVARAGHRLMELMVWNAMEAIRNLAAKQNTPIGGIKATFNDVLMTTGPALFTLSVFQYLSESTKSEFTWRNVTNIRSPILVHDLLILPVTAFGNGQSHSNAGPSTAPEALVNHQFAGSWKTGSHAWRDPGKTKEVKSVVDLKDKKEGQTVMGVKRSIDTSST